MFIVIYQAPDFNYYLRSTIWTADRDRATRFDTELAAQAGIAKSAKFNPKAAKAAKVVPA